MENIVFPIREFVIKVASRCNLNCSYCYMYNKGDNSYLKKPKFLSNNNVEILASRINDYCKKYKIESINIAFHGGEPLLLDPEYYIFFIDTFKKTITDTSVEFSLQTNGTLLNEKWFNLFEELQINVGVSLDGPKEYHDKFRLYHNGEGSFDKIIERIKGRNIGALSVLNLDIPVNDYYQFWKTMAFSFDTLIPDYTYDDLPPSKKDNISETSLGDYLIGLYDLWKNDENRTSIRFFEVIISSILGGTLSLIDIGSGKNGSIIIETDGGIESMDSLRICKNEITKNPLNISTNEIDEIHEDELYQLFLNSHDVLCSQCSNCSIASVCGGGYLAHRYSSKNDFDNPTIYCKDYAKLILHIQNDIFSRLSGNDLLELNIDMLTYEDLLREMESNTLLAN